MQGSKRVNRPLTEISVRYNNDEYIAGAVLKDVMVNHESDLYYVYNNDFRLEQTNRANGTPANAVTWDVSTSSYSLREHALKDSITKRDRDNVDAPLQLDRDTTEYLTDKLLYRREKEAADLLMTTTAFSNNTTLVSTTSWRLDTTTVQPIQNVLSATSVILANGGGRANMMVTNQDVFAALKEHGQVHERIKYVERSILTKQLLASLFDLDSVEVGTAIFNEGDEGNAVSLTNIWPGDALIARIESSPRLKTRTAAVTLRKRASGSPMRVRKWFDDDIEADWIEVQTMYTHKLIATSSAYLFKDAAV